MKLITYLAAFMLVAGCAWADSKLAWPATGFENAPANNALFAEGPARIRDTRQNIRQRMEGEHHFGSDNSDDNGLHRSGSARCYISDAVPTALAQGDFNTGGSGVTAYNALGTGSTELVGHGRCWIDRDGLDNVDGTPDDHTMYIYDEDPNGDTTLTDKAWVLVGSPIIANLDDNLVPCGTFDCTSDLNEGSSNLPPPGDWVNAAVAITWPSHTGGGTGLGNYMQTASGGGAGSDVSFHPIGLKTNTWYWVTVNMNLDPQGDQGTDGSCSIDAIGFSAQSGTDMANMVSTAQTTWVNKTGFFKTGTSLGGLEEIRLRTNRTSGIIECGFDDLGMYEVPTVTDGVLGASHRVAQKNFIQKAFVNGGTLTDQAGGSPWAESDSLSMTINLPTDGYYLRITATACVGITESISDDWMIIMRIKKGSTEIARTLVATQDDGSGNTAEISELTLIHYDLDPTIGDSEYSLEFNAESGGGGATFWHGASGPGDWASLANSDSGCDGGPAESRATTMWVEGVRN